MTLQANLEKYKELSEALVEKCLSRKNIFESECHTEVNHDGNWGIIIYFANKHKDWSVATESVEYNGYSSTFNLHKSAVFDLQVTDVAIQQLARAVSGFENKYPPKRRELNF